MIVPFSDSEAAVFSLTSLGESEGPGLSPLGGRRTLDGKIRCFEHACFKTYVFFPYFMQMKLPRRAVEA